MVSGLGVCIYLFWRAWFKFIKWKLVVKSKLSQITVHLSLISTGTQACRHLRYWCIHARVHVYFLCDYFPQYGGFLHMYLLLFLWSVLYCKMSDLFCYLFKLIQKESTKHHVLFDFSVPLLLKKPQAKFSEIMPWPF